MAHSNRHRICDIIRLVAPLLRMIQLCRYKVDLVERDDDQNVWNLDTYFGTEMKRSHALLTTY